MPPHQAERRDLVVDFDIVVHGSLVCPATHATRLEIACFLDDVPRTRNPQTDYSDRLTEGIRRDDACSMAPREPGRLAPLRMGHTLCPGGSPLLLPSSHLVLLYSAFQQGQAFIAGSGVHYRRYCPVILDYISLLDDSMPRRTQDLQCWRLSWVLAYLPHQMVESRGRAVRN
jgi:hypothetical protein